MRFKVIALALVAFLATSVMASAQSQTGEIFGKVTDSSNGVLPGVTVTLSGPSLLQPLTAATGATGTFMTGGMMWSNVLSSTAANLVPALLGSAGTPLASGSAAVTVDTTAAKLLSVPPNSALRRRRPI